MGSRLLVVNADDFGQSAGVNRGVIEAHERGIVTSASLMVRWPAAEEAARYARAHRRLSVGLHLDLGEWVFRNGSWEALYEVVPLDDGAAIDVEAAHQLGAFQRLMGRAPTHLDSHQHVHLREPVRPVADAMARTLAVPLRSCRGRIQYCGAFYGQTAEGAAYPDAITVDGLIRILTMLPSGRSELACHPGYGDDLDTMYRDERGREVAVLCDPRVRSALAGMDIELRSFADFEETFDSDP